MDKYEIEWLYKEVKATHDKVQESILSSIKPPPELLGVEALLRSAKFQLATLFYDKPL